MKKTRLPIPPDVLTLIKNTKAREGLSVIPSGRKIPDQVLKTGTLTFDPNGLLILTNLNVPFLVVVAKEIILKYPFHASIKIATDAIIPVNGAPIPKAAPAGQGDHGNPGDPGRDGHKGARGLGGNLGSNGQNVPMLYILADKIMSQDGSTLPNPLNMYLQLNGINGGAGGNGQDGQNGGQGGGGGKSYFDGRCHDAGRGGNGAAGGDGGPGRVGGNGSSGANVLFGGDDPAIAIFKTCSVTQNGGVGGPGGLNGKNGNGGVGGNGGQHTGFCNGGGAMGTTHPTKPYTPVRAPQGNPAVGIDGSIFYEKVDVLSLF